MKKLELCVSIEQAAELMGNKSLQFVRCGLQQGVFPFGFAVKKEGNQNWNYYISPYQFFKFIGADELLEEWKKGFINQAKLVLERR